MLKYYGRAAAGGESSAYWDESWRRDIDSQGLGNVAGHCENDPLFRLFERYIASDRLFLDGGCGMAQWVRYYRDRGLPTVGVDFAEATIDAVKAVDTNVDVRLGDVRRMPLKDGEVHVYYSGGVVEHFENGPDEALAEAHRVLAKDGWFLCSVPDANLLREKILYRSARHGGQFENARRIVRAVDTPVAEAAPASTSFIQYAFNRDEFSHLLEKNGFTIEQDFACGMVWGCFEIPAFRTLYTGLANVAGKLAANGARSHATPAPAAATNPRTHTHATTHGNGYRHGLALAKTQLKSLVKRALVTEEFETIPAGAALRFIAEHVSNMRMYVCRPRA